MQLLGCLLMIFLAGFFLLVGVGLSLLESILRLFGISRPRTTLKDSPRASSPSQSAPEAPKKRFADDEGEYVDFEEV